MIVLKHADGDHIAPPREYSKPLKGQTAKRVAFRPGTPHAGRRVRTLPDSRGALEYPGGTTGTGFANPKLLGMGRAHGFDATHLRSGADLERLPELLASAGPEFVVVDTSLEAVLPARNPPRVAD